LFSVLPGPDEELVGYHGSLVAKVQTGEGQQTACGALHEADGGWHDIVINE